LLRGRGHDTAYVAESSPGISDREVIDRCIAENRVLVTDDKDFGDHVVRGDRAVPGVLLIRIDPADQAGRRSRIGDLLDRHGWRIVGQHVVVDRNKARFRRIADR
jgi:hypothetical protein